MNEKNRYVKFVWIYIKLLLIKKLFLMLFKKYLKSQNINKYWNNKSLIKNRNKNIKIVIKIL